MKIDSKNISVVVQGPIDWSLYQKSLKGTTLTLTQNIRKLLPNAEIVISTWEKQQIDGLLMDKVVFSKDPGAQGVASGFTPNNVNRQIVSTVQGLKAATRPFCLKIRSDMIIEGVDFIKIFCGKPDFPNNKRKLFRHSIVTNNFSSRNTETISEKLHNHFLLFHPSDHAQFGYTEDIMKFWDIPFQADNDAYYFLERAFPNRWRMAELSRLAPEQHICVNAICKSGEKIDFKHYADYTPELRKLSDHYLDTYFISIPDKYFPLDFPKYHTQHHMSFEWMRRNDGKPVKKILPPPAQISLHARLTFPFRRPDVFKQRLKEGQYWQLTSIKGFFLSVLNEVARSRINAFFRR